MKNLKNKKGFTIVELVIVIAVIAILAAVLIPTFSGVIQRANDSADIQEARNAYIEFLAEEGNESKAAWDFVVQIKKTETVSKFVGFNDGKLVETIYNTEAEAAAVVVDETELGEAEVALKNTHYLLIVVE